MARVKTVKKAQKDQGKCEKCGTALPVGSAYVHFKVGFRSRYKHVRCTAPACYPKQSELTSSMMSDAYAAQEEAHAAIDAWEPDPEAMENDIESLAQILSDCASAANDVASQYEDSISNAPMLEDSLREKVDALEAWASELEGVSFEEFDEQDEEDLPDCDTCKGTGKVDEAECTECGGSGKAGDPEDVDEDNATELAEWGEAQRETARAAVDSLEA